MSAWIYKITNLVNGKIYIGQTIQKPNDRFKKHFYESKNRLNRKSLILNSIRKYGENNFKIDIIKTGNFNSELLNDLEIHYIRLYNSNNRKVGYNIYPGGLGFGREGKKVYQYDLNGNFIQEYKSIMEAGRKLNIISHNISVCCLEKTQTSGGFRFKFYKVNKLDKLIPHKIRGSKAEIKIKNINTEEIFQFKSNSDCARFLEKNRSYIGIEKNKAKKHNRGANLYDKNKNKYVIV